MKSQWSMRFRRVPASGVALGCAALAFTSPMAQSSSEWPENVIRVEEDWVLVLNEPNDAVTAPQFHTVMSPIASTDSYFAQVTWNYRENPDFISGGMQLHGCDGENVVRRRIVAMGELSTAAETVTWTQALATDGALAYFEIFNGQSTTWGSFGKDMRIDLDSYTSYLNDYTPEVSAENSTVTFGSNRVDSLTITQVRWYGASGLLAVDNTPRVVFQLDQ